MEMLVDKQIKNHLGTNICVVYIDGAVDSKNFEKFKEELTNIVMSGLDPIIFNLKNLEYLNSTGFGLMATLFRKAGREGKQLVLAEISPKVNHIYHLMGFNYIMISYETEEEALDSLA